MRCIAVLIPFLVQLQVQHWQSKQAITLLSLPIQGIPALTFIILVAVVHRLIVIVLYWKGVTAMLLMLLVPLAQGVIFVLRIYSKKRNFIVLLLYCFIIRD